MDPETLAVMNELRDFMFERVYMRGEQRREQEHAIDVIRGLVEHLMTHPDEIPSSFRELTADRVIQVADYVAGMTDRFALAVHDRLVSPQ